jgi:hypothetical protein
MTLPQVVCLISDHLSYSSLLPPSLFIHGVLQIARGYTDAEALPTEDTCTCSCASGVSSDISIGLSKGLSTTTAGSTVKVQHNVNDTDLMTLP